MKDPDELRAHIERRRLNPDSEDLTVVELKDGRVLERHVIPQRIHGKCVGSVITFRDITERVRYEEKMMFNHLVLENSGPMFWIDRAKLVVTYANPAACQHLGYPLDELLGMEITDFDVDFTPADMPALDEALKRSNKPVSFETRHRRKDGTIRNVEVTSFLTEAAERAMYIVTVKDVTRQKRAEQEKKRQQATLESLINSIPDRIFYKDLRRPLPGLQHCLCRRRWASRSEEISRLTAPRPVRQGNVADEMLRARQAVDGRCCASSRTSSGSPTRTASACCSKRRSLPCGTRRANSQGLHGHQPQHHRAQENRGGSAPRQGDRPKKPRA